MTLNNTVKRWVIVTGLFCLTTFAFSQQAPSGTGSVTIDLGTLATKKGLADNIELVLVLTVLALAPSIIVLMTSFTRITIVFHFLRQAMGTNSVPSNQIIVAVSMVMTFFIMTPTMTNINNNALIPMRSGAVSTDEGFEIMTEEIKAFMYKHTRKKDIGLFLKMSKMEKPENREELSLTVLVPAFIISELKTAFEIGFFIFIPFLIIDMVVASVLLSMGMMMLPPVLVSLPFKILLFVMVDGWYLVIDSLLRSFK